MQINSMADISRSKTMFKATNAESIEKRPYFLLRLSSSCQPDSERKDRPFCQAFVRSYLMQPLWSFSVVQNICLILWWEVASLRYSQIIKAPVCRLLSPLVVQIGICPASHWPGDDFETANGKLAFCTEEDSWIFRLTGFEDQFLAYCTSAYASADSCLHVRVSSFQILSCRRSRPCRCSWPVIASQNGPKWHDDAQWIPPGLSHLPTRWKLSLQALKPRGCKALLTRRNTSGILGITGIISVKQLTMQRRQRAIITCYNIRMYSKSFENILQHLIAPDSGCDLCRFDESWHFTFFRDLQAPTATCMTLCPVICVWADAGGLRKSMFWSNNRQESGWTLILSRQILQKARERIAWNSHWVRAKRANR